MNYEVCGDSSWLYIPWREMVDFRQDFVVIHLMRHPLDVMRSMLGRPFGMKDPNGPVVQTPYKQLHDHIYGGDYHPLDRDWIVRTIRHYCDRADALADMVCYIEEFRPGQTKELFKLLSAIQYPREETDMQNALRAVSTKTNSKARAQLAWEDLTSWQFSQLAELAQRHGYEVGSCSTTRRSPSSLDHGS